MNKKGFSLKTTRRQLLAGTLALAGDTLHAEKKYSPRIVCNMYYYVQLFSTPFRFISSRPDPLSAPSAASQPGRQGAGQVTTGGMEWTREQWYTALSDAQDAGYRRLEM